MKWSEEPDKDGPVNHIIYFHSNSASLKRKQKVASLSLPSSISSPKVVFSADVY